MVRFDNTDVIYRQFPFLEEVAPRGKVIAARIKRFEEKLFQWAAVDTMGEYPEGPASFYKIHLFDVNGVHLKQVGRWWLIPFQQTIAQAVESLGKKGKRVHYIVYVDTPVVTLYKMPSEFSDATDWLEKLKGKEVAHWIKAT